MSTAFEDAVDQILVPVDAPPASEAPTVEEFDDGDQGETSEPETLDDEAQDEGEADPEAEEEPEVEPIPLPNSWSKDDQAAWEGLSREAQEVVARREAQRDGAVREAGNKAAQARAEAQTQAQRAIAEQAEQYAAALAAMAAKNAPPPPDQRLLYTDDQNGLLVYQRQQAAYDAFHAQHQLVQQEIAQSQQQAAALRAQAEQAELAADAQRLQDALPEWFDPAQGPELKNRLQSAGAALGYTPEVMAEASSADILALKTAADWKAKADKWDRYQAKRMEGVRAGKALPKMVRPGAAPSNGKIAAQSAERQDAAMEQFRQTRSPEAAAALLLTRGR